MTIRNIDLSALTRRLYDRRSEAVIVPVRPWSGRAVTRNCHANVARFVLEHPGYRACYGWNIFDGRGVPGAPDFVFIAHSVVAAPDGNLFDVTPRPRRNKFTGLFLPHPGPDREFRAIVAAGCIILNLFFEARRAA